MPISSPLRRLALTGLAAALLAACQPKAAGDPRLDNASRAAVTAEQQLETLAASARAPGGHAPGYSDAAAKPLLDTLFNTSVVTSGPTPPFDHIDPLQNWLMALTKAAQIYLLAGTGVTDLSQAGSDPNIQIQVAHNLVTYAPEIGAYLDAQNSVAKVEMTSVADDMAHDPTASQTPSGQSGLTKIRAGMVQAMVGELTTLESDGLTDDWRRARMPSLVALAGPMARLLTPEQKASVRATADRVAAGMQDAEVKSQLQAFTAALQG